MNRYLIGDAAKCLSELDAGVVQTCITSPPYFGLRDYGHPGQIGLEDTPEKFIKRLVKVFDGVRRVLKRDGTLWVNLGDTYIEKQMAGIPWRLAFALQDDGWILRSEVIWQKPNAMPENVVDRPGREHEQVFLFSRNMKYHYDAQAIAEPALWAGRGVDFRGRQYRESVSRKQREVKPYTVGGTRNKRTVWSIPVGHFAGNHGAAFPPDLIRPMILASCPPGGLVLDPFLGSGTTAMVAEQEGRRWVGVELNPDYEDVIRQRTQQVGLF